MPLQVIITLGMAQMPRLLALLGLLDNYCSNLSVSHDNLDHAGIELFLVAVQIVKVADKGVTLRTGRGCHLIPSTSNWRNSSAWR